MVLKFRSQYQYHVKLNVLKNVLSCLALNMNRIFYRKY